VSGRRTPREKGIQEDNLFGRRNEPEEQMAPADEAIEADSAESREEIDGPSTDGGDPGGAVDEIVREDVLNDPAQRLAEELESVNDRLLRLAAEFENFRKRTRREQADLSATAQADLARRLLSTLDDLARVSSTPPETTTVEALDQGLDLILRNLRKELEEAGLTRIEALGARFNPEVHQSLMMAETQDPELDDTVSSVFVDGYEFRGRLLRPAQVEVLNYSPDGGEDR
jgi:molecular chaperone GrpE